MPPPRPEAAAAAAKQQAEYEQYLLELGVTRTRKDFEEADWSGS